MSNDGDGARRRAISILAGGLAATTMAAGAVASAGPAAASPPPPEYTLSVLAGNGQSGSPTPGAATSSAIDDPVAIARDSHGNVYIAEQGQYVVDKVTPQGVLSVFAGNGSFGTTAAGSATGTSIDHVYGLAVDAADNVYIADEDDYTVDKVTPAGQLSIIAGVPGQIGSSQVPPPGMARSTLIRETGGVAVDNAGNVYYTDWGPNTVNKITPDGRVRVIAGDGGYAAPTPGAATSSSFEYPYGMAFDSHRNLYLVDWYNNDVEKITPGGRLSVIAGKGPNVYAAPVPGPAANSPLDYPTSVVVDNLDNVFIADAYNYLIEKVTPSGQLSVVAGDGTRGAPTPGPALSSSIGTDYGLAVDPEGNLYVSDQSGGYVYKLTKSASAPTAPRNLRRSGSHNGAPSVRFAAPVRTGQSPITGYQYSTDGSRTWRAASVRGASPNLTLDVRGLAAGHRYHVAVRAVNAIGDGPAADITLAVPTTWYTDPLSKSHRSHLARVPAHPARTHGKARLTRAAYRTRHGHLAVPAGRARGQQLSPGQAVQSTSLFAYDSARLTKAGRATLRRLAHSLRHVHRITCEGYADYAGDTKHEKRLSRQRAKTVCAALHADRHALRVKAVGYGGAYPVVIGGSPAQRAANRRVDVLATR